MGNANNPLIIEGRDNIIIEFDTEKPEKLIADRSLQGITDRQLIKQIKAKPFITLKDIHVKVTFHKEIYEFTVKAGFCHDGATIPAAGWLLIGQPTEPRLKLASCVHDWLCEHHVDLRSNRQLSTRIFVTLCDEFGKFSRLTRATMFFFIDTYQAIMGGW